MGKDEGRRMRDERRREVGTDKLAHHIQLS
jgi:hypothetical protein